MVMFYKRAMNPFRPGTDAHEGVWYLGAETSIYLPIENDKEGKVLMEIARLHEIFQRDTRRSESFS